MLDNYPRFAAAVMEAPDDLDRASRPLHTAVDGAVVGSKGRMKRFVPSPGLVFLRGDMDTWIFQRHAWHMFAIFG